MFFSWRNIIFSGGTSVVFHGTIGAQRRKGRAKNAEPAETTRIFIAGAEGGQNDQFVDTEENPVWRTHKVKVYEGERFFKIQKIIFIFRYDLREKFKIVQTMVNVSVTSSLDPAKVREELLNVLRNQGLVPSQNGFERIYL